MKFRIMYVLKLVLPNTFTFDEKVVELIIIKTGKLNSEWLRLVLFDRISSFFSNNEMC